ncbi:hypothetical protein H4582DRAFT_1319858 [Lactarius indigo]|nr:hypothetical protein H4582DRAFT_1319858 [Lactarius indigo]
MMPRWPLLSFAGSDAPSFSIPALRHVDESLTDAPPLDNDIYAPGTFRPVHQTAIRIDHPHIPAASRGPVTHGSTDTSTTIPLSTPKPSPSAPPTSMVLNFSYLVLLPFSTSRIAATSSGVPDIPSLPSPTPVLDDMHPTEPHWLLLAPTAPGPSLTQLSSAPDPGTSTEGEGNAKTALHEERNAVDFPSTIRENIMAAPGVPPQSVTDVVIAGPPWRILGAENTGNRPPHASHDQYDIV